MRHYSVLSFLRVTEVIHCSLLLDPVRIGAFSNPEWTRTLRSPFTGRSRMLPFAQGHVDLQTHKQINGTDMKFVRVRYLTSLCFQLFKFSSASNASLFSAALAALRTVIIHASQRRQRSLTVDGQRKRQFRQTQTNWKGLTSIGSISDFVTGSRIRTTETMDWFPRTSLKVSLFPRLCLPVV